MTSREDLLAAAERFAPEIERRAPEFEEARRIPADLAARMAEARLFAMLVPQVYGGVETDPLTVVEVIERLAVADGAAAWITFIAATSGMTAAYLPEHAARTIFADPNAVISGVFAPRGKAVDRGDGTYDVAGRWQWGSGTQNAQWILGGCLILKDGKPEMLGMIPNMRLFLRPAAEVTIHDTWHVSGLKGTGSNDIEFAPARMSRDFSVNLSADKPLDRPLYAFPPFGMLAMAIAAVSLGLARAAIDALVDLAGGKTPEGHRRPLAQRLETQEKVAEAEALVRSSRAWLHTTISAAWDAAQRPGSVTIAHRRDLRLATTHAVRSCARAVDLMYALGGGSSVYDTSRLQRCFRDIHVATQHMMVGTPTLELTGRLFLGLEAETSAL
ncbi:Flavin-dependent monooxygenase, oxygenase subunit HsaA [Alphaproteobacteria bacterium SO-S41]|nr:Flavin-dependent monooxygenase, oxygenase subunit HsaA [Alphaproteobacteria bacterium SO-S41]